MGALLHVWGWPCPAAFLYDSAEPVPQRGAVCASLEHLVGLLGFKPPSVFPRDRVLGLVKPASALDEAVSSVFRQGSITPALLKIQRKPQSCVHSHSAGLRPPSAPPAPVPAPCSSSARPQGGAADRGVPRSAEAGGRPRAAGSAAQRRPPLCPALPADASGLRATPPFGAGSAEEVLCARRGIGGEGLGGRKAVVSRFVKESGKL